MDMAKKKKIFTPCSKMIFKMSQSNESSFKNYIKTKKKPLRNNTAVFCSARCLELCL